MFNRNGAYGSPDPYSYLTFRSSIMLGIDSVAEYNTNNEGNIVRLTGN
jgi:hypothetical protein